MRSFSTPPRARAFTIAALSLTTILGLSACGGTGEDQTPPPSTLIVDGKTFQANSEGAVTIDGIDYSDGQASWSGEVGGLEYTTDANCQGPDLVETAAFKGSYKGGGSSNRTVGHLACEGNGRIDPGELTKLPAKG